MRQNTVCDKCGATFLVCAGEELGVAMYVTGRKKYRKKQNGIVSRSVDLCEGCWEDFKSWAGLGPA